LRPRVLLAAALVALLPAGAPAGSRISDAEAWNDRGVARFRARDYRAALTCFETASRLRPGEETIRFNLASALARLAVQAAGAPMSRGAYASAVSEAERAIALEPEHAFFHSVLGFVHQQMGRHEEAYRAYRQAAELDPDDTGARVLLGNAAYELDSLGSAIEKWNTALDMDPDLADVRERIRKADREKGIEEDFEVLERDAFRVRYDPREPDAERLVRGMIDALADVRRDIEGVLPRRSLGPVSVVVYRREAFRELSEGRSWTEGLYDGKIRFPFPAKDDGAVDFRMLAAHEYTHAVVYEWAGGRCPAWLNEGLAQALAGEWNRAMEETARAMAREASFVPLAELEESFLGLPDSVVDRAYVEACLVGRHLLDRYGEQRLRALLRQIGGGTPVGNALRGLLGVGREELLEEAIDGSGLRLARAGTR
jgi:tetratricopeptide (TPR) repeat protein